jgi:hypothetical protein
MGLEKIEKFYNKQLVQFAKEANNEKKEIIRRNVFVNHMSKLIISNFLSFENEDDRD